jgi:hypothetical protein
MLPGGYKGRIKTDFERNMKDETSDFYNNMVSKYEKEQQTRYYKNRMVYFVTLKLERAKDQHLTPIQLRETSRQLDISHYLNYVNHTSWIIDIDPLKDGFFEMVEERAITEIERQLFPR